MSAVVKPLADDFCGELIGLHKKKTIMPSTTYAREIRRGWVIYERSPSDRRIVRLMYFVQVQEDL